MEYGRWIVETPLKVLGGAGIMVYQNEILFVGRNMTVRGRNMMVRINRIFKLTAMLIVLLVLVLNLPIVSAAENLNHQKNKIPGFDPCMAEMMKCPEFYEPFVSSPVVPEVEMTRVRFSKLWIAVNDKEPDPLTVDITFPSIWLESQPTQLPEENTIMLSVPTMLLEHHNSSDNVGEVSVVLPSRYFIDLFVQIPEEASNKVDCAQQLEADLDLYEERMWYGHYSGDSITGAAGIVRPYQYTNSGQDFIAYQEIEFYGIGGGSDAVEIISQFGSSVGSTMVWFAVWSNGDWITSFNCGTTVDVGDEVYYEFYTNEYGTTWCYLLDADNNWYYDSYYDNSPPVDYYSFAGSSEIYVDEVSHDFYVNTNPISILSLQTTTGWPEWQHDWQNAAYVYQRLYHSSTSPSVSYVDLNSIFTVNGLSFNISAGSEV
jgi:hypothetical protein